MWRILGLLVAAIVVLSVVGFVIDALRALLWVAIVLMGIAAVVGYLADRGGDRPKR